MPSIHPREMISRWAATDTSCEQMRVTAPASSKAANQLFQPPSVFDEIGAHGVVVGLRLRIMKHHHHVRFDGDAGIIAASQRVAQDVAHSSLTFAWPVVVGIIFGGIPRGVLDVNVQDVIANVGPEFPRILAWPGLGLVAVTIEDRIGGVEDPF